LQRIKKNLLENNDSPKKKKRSGFVKREVKLGKKEVLPKDGGLAKKR
jgi:hypothetical protein